MASPKEVAEPHKELRFTRSQQAQTFFLVAAVSIAFGLLLGVTWFMGHPSFHWWMPLPLFVIGFLAMRISIRCARHAYLILTPLGVEIFPLFKPEKNLNLIYWTQLEGADFDENLTTLKLHYNEEKTAGAVVSLAPISPKQRPLLEKALLGRLAEKAKKLN